MGKGIEYDMRMLYLVVYDSLWYLIKGFLGNKSEAVYDSRKRNNFS